MYSKFDQIGRQATELAALDHPKMPHWIIRGEMVFTVFFFVVYTLLEDCSKYFNDLLALR